jgi:hypothetical protein
VYRFSHFSADYGCYFMVQAGGRCVLKTGFFAGIVHQQGGKLPAF